MATSDKHCQTFNTKSSEIIQLNDPVENAKVMYDETVTVLNSKEIDSPASEEDIMSKFNPPTRHTSKHTFDSDSGSDSDGDFLAQGSGDHGKSSGKSLPSRGIKSQDLQRTSSKQGSGRRQRQEEMIDSSDNSDSDDLEADRPEHPLGGSGIKRPGGIVIPAEGAYDPKKFQDLKVPPEMENIFQYIMKYTPQKIDIDFKLQPFVPEYVPAVGDIDAYIKVTTPSCNEKGEELTENALEFIDNLGLALLDEPAAEQSDAALLHLQLRAVTKTSSAKTNVVTKKIDNAEKNTKSIERWIKDVSDLHLTKPAPNVTYNVKMPEVDFLMTEWPENMEQTLNDSGFPPASLDCSLTQYVDLMCGLFDIPIAGDTLNDRIHALHCLFTLYSAVKNSTLYADRLKEEKSDI